MNCCGRGRFRGSTEQDNNKARWRVWMLEYAHWWNSSAFLHRQSIVDRHYSCDTYFHCGVYIKSLERSCRSSFGPIMVYTWYRVVR